MGVATCHFFLVVASLAHVNIAYFCLKPGFLANFCTMMRTPANRRRSTRNRRNPQQPAAAANQNAPINFVPKLKYERSQCNEQGVFVVTKRKRAAPTEAEIEAKRQKASLIKKNKYFTLSLRHKVISLWLHGAHFGTWEFGQHCAGKLSNSCRRHIPKSMAKKQPQNHSYTV